MAMKQAMCGTVLLAGWLSLGALTAAAQEQKTPPAETVADTAPTAAPTLAPTPADGKSAAANPESAQPAQSADAVKPAIALKKKGKQPYNGPTEIVELAPTPMLDEEGRQMQDPDGKLMFNAPVRQMRDKKGHPIFDADGKPVLQTANDLGFDEHGKKIHKKKEKAPKVVSVAVSRGTLTVDGLTGKAALNYDIKDLKYIYFYVPWIGTTVISNEPFPGATAQKNAFDDRTLTVTVGDHVMQLYSDKRLLGKHPEPAYVLVDKSFTLPTKFPVMGYGPLRRAPYAWPGAKENVVAKGIAQAPPLPENLRPTLLLQPCPAGQMRMAGPAVLPGQVAPPQPCVPIVLGNVKAPAANAVQSSAAVTSAAAPPANPAEKPAPATGTASASEMPASPGTPK